MTALGASGVPSVRAVGPYRLDRRGGLLRRIGADGRLGAVFVGGQLPDQAARRDSRYLVCLVFAAGCAAKAARSATGRRRYGWLALIAALSAWAVGMVVRIFEEIRVDGHLWHPSLSQGVLMVFPVAAYACLLLLGDLDKAPRRRMVLDGIIVATSLFAVSWVCVLRNLPATGAHPV